MLGIGLYVIFSLPYISMRTIAYPTKNLIRQTECYVSRHLKTQCAQDWIQIS